MRYMHAFFFAFAMTGRPFTRLLVNSFTYYNRNRQIIAGLLLVCAGAAGFIACNRENSLSIREKEPVVLTEKPVQSEIRATETGAPEVITAQAKPATRFLYPARETEGIIGLPDNRTSDNPADNIFTVLLETSLSANDRVWLSYDLTGVTDFSGVARSINDGRATGGYLVKKSAATTRQREQLNPSELKTGENRISFSLPPNAAYGYKISKLALEVEKGAGKSPFILNASEKAYNGQVYVQGFATGASVRIGEKEIPTHNGCFEAITAQETGNRIELKAVFPNGKEYVHTLRLTEHLSADMVYPLDNSLQQAEKTFTKGLADQLQVEAATLQLDSSALLAEAKPVSVATLRHIDLPALDMGMTNVTAQSDGYRFLPHGEHFTQGATVSIGYDRTKIPGGYTEEDVKTFYFDLDTRHWIALERDSLDRQNQLVVSHTTHFTDMINGVIQTPESPETQGFAPTMMNDVKAADPTAKLQLIAPPTANLRGSAGLSYPFELPPARNGMSPQAGLQYNSDGGSGWLGEGWDLPLQSITVDTRWGVPRYSETKETETYSMGGVMLATIDDNGESSVAHRGEAIDRTADRQFYPRTEGGFSKIVRKGSSPGNYTWEITDRSGTKYTYGAGGVLKGTVRYLDGAPKEVVAEWKLTRVEELHGDWIEYVYEAAEEPVRGSLKSQAVYLKEIRAGNSGQAAHTVVALSNRAAYRSKQTHHARYGFLASGNRLLEKVSISFEGELLRSYGFTYGAGAFNADVLEKITHYDNAGNVFAGHTLEYYDDVDAKNGYKLFRANGETWNLHNDDISAGFINPVSNNLSEGLFSDKATALGGSKTTSSGFSIYVGVGAGTDLWKKSNTGGLSYGHSSSTMKGLSSLIDINGDGLADKVFVEGGALYYRPQKGNGEYGEKIRIEGVREISQSKSVSNSFGAKGFFGKFDVGVDYSHATTETDIYFSDVNSDGLVDLVRKGVVYFNHMEKDAAGNLVPTFTSSSGDTPSPVIDNGQIDASGLEVDPAEQAELIANSPMQDAVRVWEAPYSGIIKIEGNVRLQSPQGDYDEDEYAQSDGVRVAIQVGGSEKWSQVIAKGNFSSFSPSGVDNLFVNKGEKVYFRVQPGVEEMSNGSFDQVSWLPVITYPGRDNLTNPNGQGTAVFRAEEGRRVSASGSNYLP
ncbi:MAG: type IV secretion protein Rhs, partial [Dysgonamonadaceae bacterium]|nr:type IV secretion protein Rhs [Dysgonamonadaceae bacterium]